ncbi:MarR family winged helix-turn-helix transcriptional regulator [Mangrovitalea sediminis]|uniref:MarR family winged helix-turn-helix transcriptional regulator n=1 Tax=Mangrovitalea sediminis TaxID=1982043 RepID=UPI000BE4DDF9|nr:MarR family transcriptional regulator [Mangrovitalea sediminis]
MTNKKIDKDQEQFSQLLGETARAWRFELDRRLQPLGLSKSQWLVLLHAGGNGGDELTQKQLAGRVGVEGPTLVGLLDRMERDQWIERRSSPHDRRSKTVHLTAKALNTRQKIEEVATALRKELLAGIDEQDIDTCKRVLTHIRDSVCPKGDRDECTDGGTPQEDA